MGEPQLEFDWVGDDAIDPLQQAQTADAEIHAVRRQATQESPLPLKTWVSGSPEFRQTNFFSSTF